MFLFEPLPVSLPEINVRLNKMLIKRMDIIAKDVIKTLPSSANLKKFSAVLASGKNSKIFGIGLQKYLGGMPAKISYSYFTKLFVALYSLLLSDVELIPTLEMENVLALIIRNGVATEKRKNVDLPAKTVNAVLSQLLLNSDIDANTQEFADTVTETLLSFCVFTNRMFSYCFYNANYEMLCENSVKELQDGIILQKMKAMNVTICRKFGGSQRDSDIYELKQSLQ